jgi:hypothetical protein
MRIESARRSEDEALRGSAAAAVSDVSGWGMPSIVAFCIAKSNVT